MFYSEIQMTKDVNMQAKKSLEVMRLTLVIFWNLLAAKWSL